MIGEKGFGPWTWGCAGTLLGTDSTGVQWAVNVFQCPLCAALVIEPSTIQHQRFHQAVGPPAPDTLGD